MTFIFQTTTLCTALNHMSQDNLSRKAGRKVVGCQNIHITYDFSLHHNAKEQKVILCS